jgi:hypothetical protein
MCLFLIKHLRIYFSAKKLDGTVETEVLADIAVGCMNVNSVCCLYRQEWLSDISGGLQALI